MRSPQFRQLLRIFNIVDFIDQTKNSTASGYEQFREQESQHWEMRVKRRDFLEHVGKATALGLAGTALGVGSGSWRKGLYAAPKKAKGTDVKVAIIGAGLAGLSCAYELKKRGISATVYEAGDRLGGRCFSSFTNEHFERQSAEYGAEFINNGHKTMLGYANEFGLEVENLNQQPGEDYYFFDGVRRSEADVVAEFRAFKENLGDDLRSLSSTFITAETATPADAIFDKTPLDQYLESRQAGELLKSVIEASYIGEYGCELAEQSALNFILYIHNDRRSKFSPFGVFGDERYHVVGGNQLIPEAIAKQLPNQINLDHQLIAATKLQNGKIELLFQGRPTKEFDFVVFTTPFNLLNSQTGTIDLSQLNLSETKTTVIDALRYGTNSKLMVQFDHRIWRESKINGNGSIYADLNFLEDTWETNPSQANSRRGIMTNFMGGKRGAQFSESNLIPSEREVNNFLDDLGRVYSDLAGSKTPQNAARRNKNAPRGKNWSKDPLFRGSYICNHPGYFTEVADLETRPESNVFFAGGDIDSFYEWQGFAEGAANTGINAALGIAQTVFGNSGYGNR